MEMFHFVAVVGTTFLFIAALVYIRLRKVRLYAATFACALLGGINQLATVLGNGDVSLPLAAVVIALWGLAGTINALVARADKRKLHGICVEMEYPFVLNDLCVQAFLQDVGPRFRGACVPCPVHAEIAPSVSPAPFRIFAFSHQEDIPVFADAVRRLPGVVGVIACEKATEAEKEEQRARTIRALAQAAERRHFRHLAYRQYKESRSIDDIARYGLDAKPEEFHRSSLDAILASVGACEVEGRVSWGDANVGFIDADTFTTRVFSGWCAPLVIEDALRSRLRPPLPSPSLEDIVIQTEWRRQEEKTLASFSFAVSKLPFYRAEYEFIIREL